MRLSRDNCLELLAHSSRTTAHPVAFAQSCSPARASTSYAPSSGVVEGKARVLLSAAQMSELQPGEILVVHTTDVGWTPLFCIAAGVVTELGGPLSHAAVVARELDVPSVVNVDGVTRALKTGDRVRLDGDTGTIEKLPSP